VKRRKEKKDEGRKGSKDQDSGVYPENADGMIHVYSSENFIFSKLSGENPGHKRWYSQF
jgi:hypothetical protein